MAERILTTSRHGSRVHSKTTVAAATLATGRVRRRGGGGSAPRADGKHRWLARARKGGHSPSRAKATRSTTLGRREAEDGSVSCLHSWARPWVVCSAGELVAWFIVTTLVPIPLPTVGTWIWLPSKLVGCDSGLVKLDSLVLLCIKYCAFLVPTVVGSVLYSAVVMSLIQWDRHGWIGGSGYAFPTSHPRVAACTAWHTACHACTTRTRQMCSW